MNIKNLEREQSFGGKGVLQLATALRDELELPAKESATSLVNDARSESGSQIGY